MAGLKARKMIYIVSDRYRTLTEEFDIELHDIGGGCEGGDFDDLDVIFNNHKQALKRLHVGDRIEIHCFHKNKGKKEWLDMFGDSPIIFNVLEEGGQKKFKLEHGTIGSSWCYNICVEYK